MKIKRSILRHHFKALLRAWQRYEGEEGVDKLKAWRKKR